MEPSSQSGGGRCTWKSIARTRPSYGGGQWKDHPVALFVISGIPASGKSTVARLLAGRLERSVYVPGDTIRAMVISGRAEMAPGAGDPELHQLLLRYEGALAIADVYLRAGFDVIV